jgi:hypothetical protein
MTARALQARRINNQEEIMHSTNQPQTTSKSQARDAAIQIISNQTPEQIRRRHFDEVNEVFNRKKDELDRGPDGAGNMWHWSPEERARRVRELEELAKQLQQLVGELADR